jgi:hypothetical protein
LVVDNYRCYERLNDRVASAPLKGIAEKVSRYMLAQLSSDVSRRD